MKYVALLLTLATLAAVAAYTAVGSNSKPSKAVAAGETGMPSAASQSASAATAPSPVAKAPPADQPPTDPGASPQNIASPGGSYVVRAGDSLTGIAQALGVPDASQAAWLAAVLQLNGLASADHIEVGQTLTLPAVGGATNQASAAASTQPATQGGGSASASNVAPAPPGSPQPGDANQPPIVPAAPVDEFYMVPGISVPPPPIPAISATVMDASCGSLLFGKNEHMHLPPASLTKMFTALVTVQHADVNAMVTSQVSATQMIKDDESTMGLEPGMQISVRDLLYGLLLPSGNDAAQTLASYVGNGNKAAFVVMMNQMATSLGLKDTQLANPDGLDDPNLYSSTYDMALTGRTFMRVPLLAQIVGTTSYLPPGWTGDLLKNDNKLLTTYPGTYGIKIGYTDNARQTIVAGVTRGGRNLIVSVFNTKDRFADAKVLLDWAFANLPSTSCAN